MSPKFPSNIVDEPSPSPSTAPASSEIHHGKKKQQQQGLRSPLHVLNGISTIRNSESSCNSTSISMSNCSDTSSASTDAPRGCLRFFLSHSSSSSKTPGNRLKPSSKTPKSTPKVRPIKPIRSKPLKENIPKPAIKEDPMRRKPNSSKLQVLKKNSPCLCRWQPGKKPSAVGSKKSKILSLAAACGNSVDKLASNGEELENHEHSLVRVVDDKCQPDELNSYSNDLNFTPLRKMEMSSGFNRTVDKVEEENSHTGNSKTPPVQASVSPEIQCGSSVVSTVTPVCYGAGYIVSGVSDKRKCRPRGILIVGENSSYISKVKAIENFDNEEEDENIAKDTTGSVISKVPSPIEASMNWLLSPCNEEEDEDRKENSKNASCKSESLTGSIALHSLPSASSSVNALPPDIYSCNDIKLATNRRKNSTLFISPSKFSEFQGFLEPLSIQDPIPSSPTCTPNCLDMIVEEERKQRYQPNGEHSPFLTDSLGSGNVIRTPQSESSSARNVCPPWLTEDNCEKHDLNSVPELLSLENLSPASPKAIMSLTDLSFQFDYRATMSDSIDFKQFQKILDDQAFWNGNSPFSEDMLKSQMRVSWREGLMSRIYEMDEFDSCRCLSDEEEGVDCCSIGLSETPLEHNDCGDNPIVTNGSCSPKLVNDEPEAFDKSKEMLSHQIPCSCAESISTDGGGLVASGDSDWNLCYKNRLFDF